MLMSSLRPQPGLTSLPPLPDDHGAPGTLFDERHRSRRRRRRVLRWSVIPALLLIALVSGSLYLSELSERLSAPTALDGALILDGATLPPAPLPAGPFVIRFHAEDGGRLVITHRSEPERALFETVPGRAFISAARGEEKVRDSRGSFSMRDELRARCADQRLGSITPLPSTAGETAGVLISGSLRCDSGPEIRYTLGLRPRGDEVLALDLELSDASYNRALLTYRSSAGERFYGFGQQFTYFDLKGRRVPIWVQKQGIGRGTQPITLGADLTSGGGGTWYTTHAAVPHYITSEQRSLYTEDPEYQIFDLRAADRVQLEIWSSRLHARLVHGRTPTELLTAYTAWSGRMRPLPDWVHKGAIVGLQGGTARARRAIEQLKAAGVPLAAVWLSDWVGQRPGEQGKQLWWSWQLDEEHYPGWTELRADLERDGIRVLTYVNPMLVDIRDRDRGGTSSGLRRNFFAEAKRSGYLVRTPSGEPYLLRHADFSAGLVDLTNPAAYGWFLDVLRDHVLGVGASGWMADLGELLPYDAVLHSGQRGESFHNQYPEAWARLNREAIERPRAATATTTETPTAAAPAAASAGSELVFFMRAGYSQSPRYATLFWLGDQLVTWDAHDGIKSSVIGLLSGGLSGFTLNHGDVGGHTSIKHSLMSYRREKELLLRWMELGALSPVFRTHEGSSPAENAQFDSDEQTLAHLSRCARLYAAWAPYRKQLVREAAETGLPVARHLFLHHPADPAVRGLSHQQFLLGTELLAAPVLDPGVRKLSVYLPAGTWVHVWSGTVHDAGSGRTVTIDAPLGQPGLFYKQGSAVGQSLVKALREQGLLTGQ